jgi:membrane fusion protein (multidrug efflux system)
MRDDSNREAAPATDAVAESKAIDAKMARGGRLPRNRRGWIASSSLLVTVLAAGAGLAAWKVASIREADAAAASKPEPAETVALAVAQPRDHRETVTSVGTVLATRSVTLRNELAGTVSEVALAPGQIVEAGAVLVRLDVSVERAELQAQQAQAALAETLLRRSEHAQRNRAVSAMEVDRARAERDVARAQIARTQAVIARKTIRAPFRARVGLADVHRGQYLEAGAVLTTLQGIDDAAHVDFTVAQRVAAGLRKGDDVLVFVTGDDSPHAGTIVAVDARVDPATRNASVRARIEGASNGPAPGASVRVEVQDGPARTAVAVPAGAVRKGPAGDHVFVIARGGDGRMRARVRPVQSGPVLEDEVLLLGGLSPGERVAAAGSFKLRESALVAVAEELAAAGGPR